MSRLDTPTTTPSRYSSLSRTTRTSSPSISHSSYAPTLTPGGMQFHKLKVATSLALEGKAKKGLDGANVKMYLKISFPRDSVTPGMTIPICPEENIRILSSQVHPLNAQFSPYKYLPAASPMLHKAARALRLQPPLDITYQDAHKLESTHSPSIASSSRSRIRETASDILPVDERYTGSIIVTAYHISYVVPKSFPSRPPVEHSNEDLRSGTSSKVRRASIGEKTTINFMAAIDMFVPYLGRPPRSPYLLSIPIPRCLQNQIKLRIFPPNSTSSSLASLSSGDEEGNPPVNPDTSRSSRHAAYDDLADDESSDSSRGGFADGSDRIRVRWAKPFRMLGPDSEAARRKVAVKTVKAEMACIKPDVEGIVMDVEYRATCSGLWHAGVATLLGLDVALYKGSNVDWAPGYPPGWEVTGSAGYVGCGEDKEKPKGSQQGSADDASPSSLVSLSSTAHLAFPTTPSRQSSTSSTSSLLRQTLPAVPNVGDYSFENSSLLSSETSLPQGSSVSSMSSLATTATGDSDSVRPPNATVTLKININEFVPPSKRTDFTFKIAGTIVVYPRSIRRPGRSFNSANSSEEDSDHSETRPTMLPRFEVHAAQDEDVHILVQHDAEAASQVIVVSPGDDYEDPSAPKNVLKRGASSRCKDGSAVVLHYPPPLPPPSPDPPRADVSDTSGALTPPRARTPATTGSPGPVRRLSGGPLRLSRLKRDGKLMIPHVTVKVTPLASAGSALPDSYAVRATFPVPSDSGSDWVEFWLTQPNNGRLLGDGIAEEVLRTPPRVAVVSASVDGVPVRYEMYAGAAPQRGGSWGNEKGKQAEDGQLTFMEMSGKQWASWVKVHAGNGGGTVVVDYYMPPPREEGKAKQRTVDSLLHVLIPAFQLQVGRLEVRIDSLRGTHVKVEYVTIAELHSNLEFQLQTREGPRFLHHCSEDFFYPQLSIIFMSSKPVVTNTLMKWTLAGVIFLLLMCFGFIYRLSGETQQLQQSIRGLSFVVGSDWTHAIDVEPITVTETVYNNKWWYAETSTETSSSATVEPVVPSASTSTEPPASSSTAILHHGEPASPESSAPARPITPPRKPPSRASAPTGTSVVPQHMSFAALFPTLNFTPPEDTWDVVRKIGDGVWQIMRRIYHYPLDPP
ncbi:uncharacterized protein SCHCODRAFT_02608109 [Schizophyllum commune H4-8]|uniref:uncharacterized protein n=1 Tax=Schizophyllum commune (strain H4-8 / FGSC 9210) TaxID=578458 RepID=UPI002160D8FA|nr:uncharacterized protein SCHCODRAFT_02608109 [Schizophyllum commune H4-8]KAI5900510.1 hypothetical protein SCHCODRAFT_02608109 [Schizophyllum commune H4-8]